MSVACFSCGATQTPVTEQDIPAQRVWLCADCADLFREAGLIDSPITAIASPAPGYPSTG